MKRKLYPLPILGIVAILGLLPRLHAGTAKDFFQNQAMTTAGNYNPSGTPTNTNDVRITSTANPQTITNAALTLESLSIDNGSTHTVGNNTGAAGNSTLNIGNSAGFTNVFSTVANDLIYLTGSSTLTIQGANLQSGQATGTGTLSVVLQSSGNFNVGTGSNLTISAPIGESGTRSITKTGGGTATLSGSNTYTGGTNVNAGTLALGASNVLANTGAVAVGGGTFNIGANSDTVGAVTLTSGSITGTTGVLTGSSYGVQGGTISGHLGGTGALTKTTAGTVVLSSSATYTGGTNINGGVLQLTANNVLPDTGTISMGGGTLQLVNTQEGTTVAGGIGAGPLSLTSSSIIDLNGTDVLHLAASNAQPWVGTLSIYNYNGTLNTGNGTEQILFGSNNLALTTAQLNQISFYSGAGTGFLGTAQFAPDNDGEIIPFVAAIPEPGTWAAGALVFTTLLVMQRRRFARRQAATV